MASRLKNSLSITNLAPGATLQLAHGLKASNGLGLAPDIAFVPEGIDFVSQDGTTITFVNNSGGVVTGTVLVEYWHTIERAFGVQGAQSLSVKPIVVQGVIGLNATPQPPFDPVMITIYVRTTGSDTTGDGSLANPYRTYQFARRKVPSVAPAGVGYILDITGIGVETLPVNWQDPVLQGTFFGAANAPAPFLNNHVLNIRAFPQLYSGIPAADAVITVADAPVLTSNANTNLAILTLGVGRASWAASALKGQKFIRTIGTSQTSCEIYDSNATQLFLCNKIGPGPNFIPALAPGEEFHIVEPSATLEAPPSTDFDGGALRFMNVSSVGFQGVRIRCATPGADFGMFIAGASQPFFELCDLPDMLLTGDAQYQLAMFSTSFGDAGGNGTLIDSDTWAIRRCYFKGVADFSISSRHSDINLSVFENCAAIRNKIAAPGFVTTPHILTTFSIFDTLITGSTEDAVHAQGGQWGLANVQIQGATGSGLLIENGINYVQCDHLTGNANGGGTDYGIKANDGAQVQIKDATTMTLTGGGGDVKSGNLAAAAYAASMNQYDITAVGAGGATGTGTRIFERAF